MSTVYRSQTADFDLTRRCPSNVVDAKRWQRASVSKPNEKAHSRSRCPLQDAEAARKRKAKEWEEMGTEFCLQKSNSSSIIRGVTPSWSPVEAKEPRHPPLQPGDTLGSMSSFMTPSRAPPRKANTLSDPANPRRKSHVSLYGYLLGNCSSSVDAFLYEKRIALMHGNTLKLIKITFDWERNKLVVARDSENVRGADSTPPEGHPREWCLEHVEACDDSLDVEEHLISTGVTSDCAGFHQLNFCALYMKNRPPVVLFLRSEKQKEQFIVMMQHVAEYFKTRLEAVQGKLGNNRVTELRPDDFIDISVASLFKKLAREVSVLSGECLKNFTQGVTTKIVFGRQMDRAGTVILDADKAKLGLVLFKDASKMEYLPGGSLRAEATTRGADTLIAAACEVWPDPPDTFNFDHTLPSNGWVVKDIRALDHAVTLDHDDWTFPLALGFSTKRKAVQFVELVKVCQQVEKLVASVCEPA